MAADLLLCYKNILSKVAWRLLHFGEKCLTYLYEPWLHKEIEQAVKAHCIGQQFKL